MRLGEKAAAFAVSERTTVSEYGKVSAAAFPHS